MEQKNFGKQLKYLIKSAGYTQKSFSKEIGVCENSVYNWCNGKSISLSMYKILLNFFVNNQNTKTLPIIKTRNNIVNTQINDLEFETRELKEKYDKEINKLKEQVEKLQLKNEEQKETIRKIKYENKKLKMISLNSKLTKYFEDWEYDLEKKTKDLERKQATIDKRIETNVKKALLSVKNYNIDTREMMKYFLLEYAKIQGEKYNEKRYHYVMTFRNSKATFDKVVSGFNRELGNVMYECFEEEYQKVLEKVGWSYNFKFKYYKQKNIDSILEILDKAVSYQEEMIKLKENRKRKNKNLLCYY